MIERVARAICKTAGWQPDIEFEGEPFWKQYEYESRAAIEAMREPTRGMSDKATEVMDHAECGWGPEISYPVNICDVTYTAMIDAALADD